MDMENISSYFFSHLGLGNELQRGPHFISSPDTYSEKLGGTVKLICRVDNLGKLFGIRIL